MLFAMFGRYNPEKITEVHLKENQVFESPPRGIKVVARYSEVGRKGGFIHIVEAESAEALGALVLKFVGLIEFDIVPISSTVGGRAATIVSEYTGEVVSMYGPVEVPVARKEIESLLKEVRRFEPPESVARTAYISSLDEYRMLYRKSVDNPEAFWAERAEELDWFKKWDRVYGGDFANGEVAWFIGGKLNAAYNCLDRHIGSWRKSKTAIIWESEQGETRSYSYHQLFREVSRFGNVLKRMGVRKGDRVVIYLPMIPEAVISMLACARIGAVHSVVFGGFSSEALRSRIQDSGARFLVTSDGGFRGGKIISMKLNADRALEECPTVEKVIVVKRAGIQVDMQPGRDFWWDALMSDPEISDVCEPEEMDAEDPLFTLYTSGSTGKPKGQIHTMGGYLIFVQQTFKYIFDVKDDDIFWCAADVGWVTGHSYLVYGPLLNGATQVMFEGIPTYPQPDRFWEVIEKHGVTVFYTAPTAIRALMAQDDEWVTQHDLSSLRILGTVGEPINPEAWMWYYRVVGKERCPIMDTWWQTETGGILITPLPGAIPTKPGSCSFPFFGIVPDILDAEGNPVPKGVGGHLVIKRPWPGMTRGIYGDPARFKEVYFTKFPGVYYTGDGARQDDEGFYWVMGRLDDVINVSGHRIGTAEVESALVAHPKVAESAVVGFPHAIKGQGIFAFVTLTVGAEPSDHLRKELVDQAAQMIGPIAKPDVIVFTPGLPKTRSGKIMRRILRKLAEGDSADLGDTSTLADPAVVESLVELVKKAQ
jgi:acetyl-CoA synthetase